MLPNLVIVKTMFLDATAGFVLVEREGVWVKTNPVHATTDFVLVERKAVYVKTAPVHATTASHRSTIWT